MNVIIDGIEYVPKGEVPPINDESLKECLRHLVNIQYFTDDRHKHRAWGWDALNALAPELAALPAKQAWDRIYDENSTISLDISKYMTPTPRTDANAVWPASNDDSDKPSPQGSHVDADFARELERENARLWQMLQTPSSSTG